jgi:hypothetical protein
MFSMNAVKNTFNTGNGVSLIFFPTHDSVADEARDTLSEVGMFFDLVEIVAFHGLRSILQIYKKSIGREITCLNLSLPIYLYETIS